MIFLLFKSVKYFTLNVRPDRYKLVILLNLLKNGIKMKYIMYFLYFVFASLNKYIPIKLNLLPIFVSIKKMFGK